MRVVKSDVRMTWKICFSNVEMSSKVQIVFLQGTLFVQCSKLPGNVRDRNLAILHNSYMLTLHPDSFNLSYQVLITSL